MLPGGPILAPMYPLRRHRFFWTLLVLVAGMILAMGAAEHIARQRALRDESASVRHQLDLYAQALKQRIDRYRTLPQVLALDAELRDAVAHPLNARDVERLNRKLEGANGASQSSTLTLIDRNGVALAASNWRDQRNNVGVDYSFRPYVRQALSQGRGHFYGIGLTTGVAGYFLSQAILDAHGEVQGVVVIKIALEELEREWLQMPDIVLASDAHGVVFLASRSEWRYRLLAPLSSKGAAGVTGAGFITLAATLAVVPEVPVAGMALILGVDRFMSECRSLTNFMGNAVATIVVSRWENALDHEKLMVALDGGAHLDSQVEAAVLPVGVRAEG